VPLDPVEALAILSTDPSSGSVLSTEDPVALTITLNQAASGTVGTQSVTSDSGNVISVTIDLEEGENSIDIDLQNGLGDTLQETLTIYQDTIGPDTPNASDISVTVVEDEIQVTGVAGSVEPDSTVILTNLTEGTSVFVIATIDGAFQGTVPGSLTDDIETTLEDSVMNQGGSLIIDGASDDSTGADTTTADPSNASTISGVVSTTTGVPIDDVEVSVGI